MEPTVLYELLGQARAENKAVQLLNNTTLNDVEFIIEPEHQIVNKKGNVIKVDDCLIDLNFIVAALIVPNREDRNKELERIEQEIDDVYKPSPKGRRYRS
ncbi:MAG: hypothetical protein IJJ11_00730 [Methanosphaera sp.]|nr:hypothetical protein [Methanobrevibacter sp.]MBQ6443185.1 hypothetical protein [Methanosphaera sp.]